MKKFNSGCNEIGYGEGISQTEDVDLFDERPNLIRTGFGEG